MYFDTFEKILLLTDLTVFHKLYLGLYELKFVFLFVYSAVKEFY